MNDGWPVAPPSLNGRPVVAVFDLDRTITDRGTFTRFLIHVAKARPWLFAHVPDLLFAQLERHLGTISRDAYKSRATRRVLGGMEFATLDAFARDFAARWCATRLRPGAVAAVRAHAGRGDRLIMVTAAYEFYARYFAEFLGIGEVIATRSVWTSENRLEGAIDGFNCYGEEKLRRVRPVLDAARRDADMIVYTDHPTDLPLLRWADRGYVVNPKPAMRRLAEAENLPVLDWGVPAMAPPDADNG
jgi:HAD superfamily hydrolase (TIGR01490 family)